MSIEHAPERQRRRRGASSIAEFCQTFGISIPMFYKLKAKGEAPDVMKVGTRTLISDAAADKWRRDRERAARQLEQQTS